MENVNNNEPSLFTLVRLRDGFLVFKGEPVFEGVDPENKKLTEWLTQRGIAAADVAGLLHQANHDGYADLLITKQR